MVDVKVVGYFTVEQLREIVEITGHYDTTDGASDFKANSYNSTKTVIKVSGDHGRYVLTVEGTSGEPEKIIVRKL